MYKRKLSTITVLLVLLIIVPIPPVRAQGGWFNENFAYRKSVSINGTVGAGTDYQVYLPIIYDSDMQADFDDLRFTDNDGTTELDYWIETYVASTSAVVWVEVADDLGSNQTIYMYYGESKVSTTSNGTDTFLFYEDWASETVDAGKWDTITNDGSIAFDDTDANHGSVLEVEGGSGTDVYELRTVSTTTAPTSIIGRLHIESTSAASQRTVWGMGSMATVPLVLVRSIEGTEDFLALDDDSNSDSNGLLGTYFDTYRTFMITRDGTDARLYSDYVLVTTVSCEPDTVARNAIGLYVRDSEYQIYCDWVAHREFIADGPIGGTFGDEEAYADYLGLQDYLDFYLIFLGLCMVPASTIYLVRGGKEEMSRDKLFYFLIAFMIGWSLLIGGIMP